MLEKIDRGVLDKESFPKDRRPRSVERKMDGIATRIGRVRSRSPFAVFGLGDRERSTSGKRTFNIKATNGKQVLVFFKIL